MNETSKSKLNSLKKVDLHLHLDGSLPFSVIPKLAELSGIVIEEDKIRELFSVHEDCRNLVDYLKCFDMPGALLQREDTLSLATKALVEELYQEKTMLAEIRFAPQLHKKQGLTGKQIVEAVIHGMNQGLENCPGMKCGIILCMMIGGSEAENMEAVELCENYLGKGVVALDIAGAEGMLPMISFKPFFDVAEAKGIPYTIHAGECGDYRNVDTALDLGAKRIGHGVAAIYSQATIDRLVQTRTPIEVCLISNLQTNSVPQTEVHPVKKLLDAGVVVTVNTDNRTVSQTNLNKEYALLLADYGFTEEDLIQVISNGMQASFIE